jgi:sulfur-oxidizing protein SoxY
MTMKRRRFLQGTVATGAAGAALGTGLVTPRDVLAARPADAFTANKLDAALDALYGSTDLQPGDITLKAPDIAENGAVVPITVEHNIDGAESISIIAENNPNPLAASFDLTPSSGGLVSTRIKMGKTSNVHAVVKAGGKLYSASKEVKVTIGGCGG